jgi:glycosyltransferase involved in cell wall biosynthesis
MACGTPMVSFEVGGVPDLVRPDITGYLAKPQDYRDFAQGVMSLLEEDKLRMNMANQCREIALKEYSIDLMAKRYIALYEQVIFGSNASKGLDT